MVELAHSIDPEKVAHDDLSIRFYTASYGLRTDTEIGKGPPIFWDH